MNEITQDDNMSKSLPYDKPLKVINQLKSNNMFKWIILK